MLTVQSHQLAAEITHNVATRERENMVERARKLAIPVINSMARHRGLVESCAAVATCKVPIFLISPPFSTNPWAPSSTMATGSMPAPTAQSGITVTGISLDAR
mmetsp:Transcript_16172/g.32779  ORF Transcript_16172/g.32779 Transcript_16172/m.32779 type:complete len:103 (+) Transcript_16172:591-899(+)